jgi:glycosyltransferase involved in cell wall biosynthesis
MVNGLTLPLSDTVVGVSQAVSDSYLNWEELLLGDTRRETIWNGTDIEAIRGTFHRSDTVLQEFTPFSSDDFILGTMGRLHKQKGYEYLIRVFPEMRPQTENIKLLIIGDGPKRDQLQTIAHQTGYVESIHFTGYVPNVYSFLPNFDIAVFPSQWEGFGLTPCESMASERPVIVTDIPPFREVIGDAGALVEPESTSALAEEIISLIQNPKRRHKLGQAGYERATEKFSIERTVEEYASLYRDLANE